MKITINFINLLLLLLLIIKIGKEKETKDANKNLLIVKNLRKHLIHLYKF